MKFKEYLVIHKLGIYVDVESKFIFLIYEILVSYVAMDISKHLWISKCNLPNVYIFSLGTLERKIMPL